MGSSGSGKSSLVRAGVIPRLKAGLLGDAGPRWRIAKMRPGSSPIASLARELGRALPGEGIEVTLRRGPLGLVQAVAECRLPPSENVLVIVDQFEELFRYEREAQHPEHAREQAAAFVKLLLEAAAQRAMPIYVVVTMRSDYLGNCARFRDLPERVNEGLYLVPRMRRDQLEQAIRGPIAVEDADIEPRLLQKLLNETGDDPDQLPLLQHALLRTWNAWNHAARPLDLEDLDAVGGMKDGLSRHADEIYASLSLEQQRVTRVMFQQLSERDPEGREIRRPTPMAHVAAVAATNVAAVESVVEKFAAPDAALVYRNEDGHLDITHESLIRKWVQFQGASQSGSETTGWLHQEADARDQFRRLIDRAANKDPLMGRALDDALAWRRLGLTAPWSKRYVKADNEDAFEKVTRFIEECRTNEVARQRRRRWWQVSALTASVVALAVVTMLWRSAEEQKAIADRLADDAEKQAQIAEDARKIAEEKTGIAEAATKDALEQKRIAEDQTKVANDAADKERLQTARAEFATLAADGARLSALAQLPDRATDALVSALRLAAPTLGSGRSVPPQAIKGLTDAIAAVGFSVPQNHLLRGLNGRVEAVTVSPDGERILTSATDGKTRLSNARSLALLQTYDRAGVFRSPGVAASSFSRDGKRAVLALRNRVVLIDASTGDIQRQIGDVSAPMFAGFSDDGTRIITTGTGLVRLWSAATGEPIAEFTDKGAILFAALSADNTTLAYGGQRQVVVIRNVESGDQVEERMSGWVLSGAFAPTGSLLLVGSENGTLLWNVQDKSVVRRGPRLQRIDAHAFSARLIAIGAEVRNRDSNLDVVATLPRTSGNNINFSALSQDGTRVVTTVTADDVARVWDTENGSLLAILEGHHDSVLSAAFTPDDRQVVTSSGDGTARVWNLPRDLSLATVTTGTSAIRFVATSPEGRRVVSVSDNGDAVVWTPAQNGVVTLDAKVTRFSAPVFSANGTRVLAADDGDIARMFDATTGATLAEYRGHRGAVRSVALSPDGSLVVTGGEDATVRIWDAGSGQQRHLLRGHTARIGTVQFSPNGERIASSGLAVNAKDDPRALIWSLDGKLLTTLAGPLRQLDVGAFSANSPRIVGEIGAGRVAIWDVRSGVRLRIFEERGVPHAHPTFSHDGSRIVTTDSNGAVRLRSTRQPDAEPTTFRGDSGEAEEGRLSPDGKRLLSYGRNQDLLLWDVVSNQVLVNFAGERIPAGGVAFMPDGLRFVVASGSQVKIYPATAEQFLTLGCNRLRHRKAFEQLQALCQGAASKN
jgi:WD40 repeat protein